MAIKISKKDFMREHSRLLKRLLGGKKSDLKKEYKDQKKELKDIKKKKHA